MMIQAQPIGSVQCPMDWIDLFYLVALLTSLLYSGKLCNRQNRIHKQHGLKEEESILLATTDARLRYGILVDDDSFECRCGGQDFLLQTDDDRPKMTFVKFGKIMFSEQKQSQTRKMTLNHGCGLGCNDFREWVNLCAVLGARYTTIADGH